MKRSRSLSTKIILMVEAILLLSSAIFCAVLIHRSRTAIRQSIQQRMVDIANCASGSVNGDILESLKPGDEDTQGYRAVYDTMAVFRDNVELEYVYAIRDEGNGRFSFIVDTDPDAPGAWFRGCCITGINNCREPLALYDLERLPADLSGLQKDTASRYKNKPAAVGLSAAGEVLVR